MSHRAAPLEQNASRFVMEHLFSDESREEEAANQQFSSSVPRCTRSRRHHGDNQVIPLPPSKVRS